MRTRQAATRDPGVTSGRARRGQARQPQTETRERIIAGALAALAANGYAGTTARVVAAAADVPVGLLFYHFQTLDGLMLAALDHTSEQRLPRWREVLGELTDATEVLQAMSMLYDEDMRSGHAVAVRELVSGGAFAQRFGEQLAGRMAPWFDLAQEVATRVLQGTMVLDAISARDLAMAAIALYLGLDVVARVAGDSASAGSLVAAAQRLAPLLQALAGRPAPPRQRPRRVQLD